MLPPVPALEWNSLYSSSECTLAYRSLNGYSVEVPEEFGIPAKTLLDDLPLPDQRRAVAWLIDSLPKVTDIKAALDEGTPLERVGLHSGALGVLRWIIGTCRAYLKETKAGEGLLNSVPARSAHGISRNIRQFTFVVGSPKQESNFKAEIEAAKTNYPNCAQYPTFLAFHGGCGDPRCG